MNEPTIPRRCRRLQQQIFTQTPTTLPRLAEIPACAGARPRTAATLSDPGLIAPHKRSLEVFPREVRR